MDVDVRRDTPLFVDPAALLIIKNKWAAECRHLIQNFFHNVLDAIRTDDEHAARSLLSALREPNETHLGLSKGRAQGHGMGEGLAERVWESLSESPAVKSGLLLDLQDTALLVAGVDRDIISDITTNLIREPLIRYTQTVCEEYGIPTALVDSGPLWQPNSKTWISRHEGLPMGPYGRLLLVPKTLVRLHMTFRSDEYFRDYILTHLQGVHLQANTALVTVLKSGDRVVYKNRLEKEYGTGKHAAVELTTQYPQVLEKYRKTKKKSVAPPMTDLELSDAIGAPATDWDALLAAVTAVNPGNDEATAYHRAVKDLLEALFYPPLVFPEIEQEINQGRKRIDILFTNQAKDGFFAHVRDNYFAPYVAVECKNYAGDPKNPELDQLAGRFSNLQGRVGILCCRSMTKKDLFIERCRDTAVAGNGVILPLDDDDLERLVRDRTAAVMHADGEELLRQRLKRVIL